MTLPAATAPIPGPADLLRLVDMRDPQRWLDALPRVFDRYGDLIRVPLGLTTLYAVRDPDVFSEVFRSPAWDKRADLHKYHHMLMGNGLVTSPTDERWQRRRKAVQPHYSTGRLGSYVPVMQQVFDRCFGAWDGGGTFDAHEVLRDATMRINLDCLLQVDFEPWVDRIHHIMGVLSEPQSVVDLSLPIWVPTALKRTHVTILAELDAMVGEVVRKRRAEGIDRGDYLSSLMTAEAAAELTDTAIRDEIVTLLVAGHETTASALAWTLYELAERPDWQDRLAAIATPAGGWTPESLRASADATKVSVEGLRLYPPVMIFIPRQASEATSLGGVAVAKGSFVLMFPYLAQRHAGRVDHPDRFDPDRGGDGGMPFAGGRRKCAGAAFAMAEMNLFLIEICQRWRFSRAGAVAPRFVNGALMPAAGVPLRVEAR